MSLLRKWQLRATIAGHFGVILILAGGALQILWMFLAGVLLAAVGLTTVGVLWFIMWRRGE
ncbi:MAG: hypothetical protein NXI22_21145 [bacterium]|nr:hypothetical protein [bacterium]